MKEYEFIADIKNGNICLPDEYSHLEALQVNVKLNISKSKVKNNEVTQKFIDDNWQKILSDSLTVMDADDPDVNHEYGNYLTDKHR
jgi:hypothetical protein